MTSPRMAGRKPRCYRRGCGENPCVFAATVSGGPSRATCAVHASADIMEAVGLLRDYVRVYPKNSGRAIRFLAALDEAN